MHRRTFCKSSLAIPLLGQTVARTPTFRALDIEQPPLEISSFSLGPLHLDCLIGAPAPAAWMTKRIEQFAAAMCQRYFSDVILYRAGEAPVNVRERLGCRSESRGGSPAQVARWARFADGSSRRPRIYLVDSSAIENSGDDELTLDLRIQDLSGYSVVILDDWRTYIDQAEPMTVIDPRSSAAVQRFASATLSALQMRNYYSYASDRGLSLAFAFIQSTRGKPASTVAMRAVEAALQQNPDRRVILHNSDLCVATTASASAHGMNVWALSHGGANHRPYVTVD